MGFRTGAYARIWNIDNKGKYSICNISISKRKKDSDEFETEFQDGFVSFVGEAHEFVKDMNVPQGGIPIKIGACDVTTKYDPNKKTTYVNYAIFGVEDASFDKPAEGKKTAAAKSTAKSKKSDADMLDDDDAQLPF